MKLQNACSMVLMARLACQGCFVGCAQQCLPIEKLNAVLDMANQGQETAGCRCGDGTAATG